MLHKKLSLDKDYIAKHALPFLLPLAVEPGLNISQVTECLERILVVLPGMAGRLVFKKV